MTMMLVILLLVYVAAMSAPHLRWVFGVMPNLRPAPQVRPQRVNTQNTHQR